VDSYVTDAGETYQGCMCAPDATACQGDLLVTCGPGGIPLAEPEGCLLGCDDSATPRCRILEPSNITETVCETPSMAYLMVESDLTIDTDGACDGEITQGGGAPGICVLVHGDVTIAAGATLTVTGSRALALVATGSFVVDGTIAASANLAMSGPGAPFTAGAGGAAGAGNVQTSGGGGGNGEIGGDGSTASTSGAGGLGGAAVGTDALVPLTGGGAGGAGGPDALGGGEAAGGGGGGAIQLVACGTFTLGADGVIHANGGGGAGGAGAALALDAPNGGAGGGAGGSILIEAASFTTDGGVFANGGGGGGGGQRAVGGAAGMAGQNGQDGLVPAAGGLPGTAMSGVGGPGGAGSTPAAAGGVPPDTMQAAGGAGGGVGVIRVNNRAGEAISEGTHSPPWTVGVVGTR
jgi:hypothetical protein